MLGWLAMLVSSSMQDYTKLLVWQQARALTVSVHEATLGFPPRSAPGLRAQTMRATMSIGASIAEGAAKASQREFARYLEIAAGSAGEVQHHLTVAGDLGVIGAPVAARLSERVIEIRRMLFGLRRAVLESEEGESEDGQSDDR
jgi:four helix bundle protein